MALDRKKSLSRKGAPRSPSALANAFDNGDLISPALHGVADQWTNWAARGLIVDPAEGIRGLEAFDTPKARYFAAIAAWIGGMEDDACRGLEALGSRRAKNILKMIRRKRIDVLTQLPPVRGGSFSLLDGIAADQKFRVRNVGGLEGDLRLEPNSGVMAHLDTNFSPNFFFCSMVEWHPVPTDIGSLPFPTIGYTSDYDAHIMTTASALKAFDCVFTCDQVLEWAQVRKITGKPCYAYPVVFNAPSNLPDLSGRERDIDVFFSGTLLSSYHPDKAALINQLLRIPDINLLLVDGHLSWDDYYDLLSRAKITQSFCRHPGAMLTRGIEAASLGSINLFQEDSVNRLWGGEDEGVFTFDEVEGPGSIVQRVLADYDRYGDGCGRHAANMREAFSAKTVASRLFRFASAIAANLLVDRKEDLAEATVQRRHIFIYGPRPLTHEAKELCRGTYARLSELFEKTGDPAYLNDRAREIALLHGQTAFTNEAPPQGDISLDVAIRDLERAAALAPDALVPRFNLLRILLHLTDGDACWRGVNMLREILDRPLRDWHVDTRDDVYPYDFFVDLFNGRDYLDAVCAALAGDETAQERMRDLIVASVHHYLAVICQSVERARSACSLDPVFPAYQMTMAGLLAGTTDAGALAEARDLYTALGDKSVYVVAAFHHRRQLDARLGKGPDEKIVALARVVERVEQSVVQTQSHRERLHSEFYCRARLRVDARRGVVIHKCRSGDAPRIRLSIVVCGVGGNDVIAVLRGLAEQTVPRRDFEVIYVEVGDRLVPESLALVDTALTLAQDTFMIYRAVALNEGLAFVNGDVVAFVEPGTAPEPEFVADVLRMFFSTPLNRLNRSDVVAAQCLYLSESEATGSELGNRAVVCPTDWAQQIQGFDDHSFFSGVTGQEVEFAWRLQQAGLPVIVQTAEGARLQGLQPWWRSAPWRNRATRRGVAKMLHPNIYDPKRTAPLEAHDDAGALIQPPVLLGVYEHFNLVACRGKIYGVSQEAGNIDFLTSESELLDQLAADQIVIGETVGDVHLAIDGLSVANEQESARPPSRAGGAAVIHTAGRFNIIEYDYQYFGVHHDLGPVDVMQERDLDDPNFQPPKFLCGSSLEELMVTIDVSSRALGEGPVAPLTVAELLIAPLELETVGRYNIVRYQDRYYALHQQLGPLDLAEINNTDDERLMPPMYLSAENLDDLHVAVVAARRELGESLTLISWFRPRSLIRELHVFGAKCFRRLSSERHDVPKK